MQFLRLIKDNMPSLHLDELKGIDLVIFLGNAQIGKNSTINNNNILIPIIIVINNNIIIVMHLFPLFILITIIIF